MHEQCVPGAPSDFLSAWEQGYCGTYLHQLRVLVLKCVSAVQTIL